MELKEFIKETLTQITKGITESQEGLKDTGAIVVPKLSRKTSDSYHMTDGIGAYQQVHEIKFKLGVTVEDKTGSRGGLGVVTGVFSAGGQASNDTLNQSISSIEFTIPIVFPPGNNVEKRGLPI